MKRILLAIVAVSFGGAALAADGAAVYAAKCVACHGKDGKGSAAGQKMGADDLTKLDDSEAKIVKVITDGDGKMPSFKTRLSAEEIQAVAKFVKGGLK